MCELILYMVIIFKMTHFVEELYVANRIGCYECGLSTS